MTIRKMGWIPDAPDGRDFQFRSSRSTWQIPNYSWWDRMLFSLGIKKKPALPVANKVDLRSTKFFPPIYEQGALGSCTSNVLACAMAFLEAKEGNGVELLSRLFVYYYGRNGVPSDDGLSIRDGLKGIAAHGVSLEALWPYDTNRWMEAPSIPANIEGAHRSNGLVYMRLQTLQEMIECLNDGYPFGMGVTLHDSFNKITKENPVVPMPNKGERTLGGHALCVVGYDMDEKQFIVRNSWGDYWGDGGHCLFPFDYLSNSDLSRDFWTVRKIEK
jgi:C1A family cysteine protease